MRVIIEANEQYKDMFLEIAKAIKAKIIFQENEKQDHVKERTLEGQEQVIQGKVEEVAPEYNTKSIAKASTEEKNDTYDPDFVKMVLESAKQKKGKVIKTVEDIIYSAEFVERIKRARESENFTTINPDDLWGSLGL